MTASSRGIRLYPTFRTRPSVPRSSLRASTQVGVFQVSQRRWQGGQQYRRPLGFEPDTSRRDYWVKISRYSLAFLTSLYALGYIRGYYLGQLELEAKSENAQKKNENGENSDEAQGAGEDDVFLVPAEKPEDAFFLSLWLPSKVEKTKRERVYASDDPAFKSMLELFYNTKAMKELKEKYCEDLRRHVSSHPAMQKSMGGELKVAKYWIDIKPIPYQPDEYERWGIELNDEGDAYILPRKMTASERNRIVHFLWPKAITLAIRDYWKSLLGDTWRNLQSLHPSAVSTTAASQVVPSLKNVKSTGSPVPSDDTNGDRSNDSPASTTLGGALPNVSLDYFRKWYGKGSALSRANRAFFLRLDHMHTHEFKSSERGDMLVEGQIELVGPRGEVKYAVRGYFNALRKEWRVWAHAIYQGPNWRTMQLRKKR